jgi:hypothetical protein
MLLFTIESLSCFDEGFYPMFPSNRDGNFTHRYPTRQVRARVSFFTRGSDPHPPCESAGAGAGFIFHPWVWISEISNFDGFDPVSPPKFPSASKFCLSPTLSPTQVLYHNPRWCSSYSPTPFFSWFFNPSCPCDWIHLYFAQTRGWPETRQVWVRVRLFTRGCAHGRVWAGAMGVAAGGFLSNLPCCHPYLVRAKALVSSCFRTHFWYVFSSEEYAKFHARFTIVWSDEG